MTENSYNLFKVVDSNVQIAYNWLSSTGRDIISAYDSFRKDKKEFLKYTSQSVKEDISSIVGKY